MGPQTLNYFHIENVQFIDYKEILADDIQKIDFPIFPYLIQITSNDAMGYFLFFFAIDSDLCF